jgi:hypothetical protein
MPIGGIRVDSLLRTEMEWGARGSAKKKAHDTLHKMKFQIAPAGKPVDGWEV